MARLPTRGATVITPVHWGEARVLDETDLRDTLSGLCPSVAFSPIEIQNYYFELAAIIGSHSAEQRRPETTVLVRELGKVASGLAQAAVRLQLPATGLHDFKDFDLVTQLELLPPPWRGNMAFLTRGHARKLNDLRKLPSLFLTLVV